MNCPGPHQLLAQTVKTFGAFLILLTKEPIPPCCRLLVLTDDLLHKEYMKQHLAKPTGALSAKVFGWHLPVHCEWMAICMGILEGNTDQVCDSVSSWCLTHLYLGGRYCTPASHLGFEQHPATPYTLAMQSMWPRLKSAHGWKCHGQVACLAPITAPTRLTRQQEPEGTWVLRAGTILVLPWWISALAALGTLLVIPVNKQLYIPLQQ